MAQQDAENQVISWKYYTPLKGEPLATMLGHISSPGLVTIQNPNDPTRPLLQIDQSRLGLRPCSVLLRPQAPQQHNQPFQYDMLVKVVFGTQDGSVAIQTGSTFTFPNHVAGISYKFTTAQEETGAKNEYAHLDSLELIRDEQGRIIKNDAMKYEGIIIGQAVYYGGQTGHDSQEVTYMGADFSDLYLRELGWNEHMWLAPISPRRWTTEPVAGQLVDPGYDLALTLELRDHNNQLSRVTSSGYNMVKINPVLQLLPAEYVQPQTGPAYWKNPYADGIEARYLAIGIDKTVEDVSTDPSVHDYQCSLKVLAAADTIQGLKVPLGDTPVCVISNYFDSTKGIDVRRATYQQDIQLLAELTRGFLSGGSNLQVLEQQADGVPKFSDRTVGTQFTGTYLKDGVITEARPQLKVLTPEEKEAYEQQGIDMTGFVWLEEVS